MTEPALPPLPADAEQLRDTAFWRAIIAFAAFLTCLSPLLLGRS